MTIDWSNMLAMFSTFVVSLGGVEGVKMFLNRKTDKRLAEIEVNRAEFNTLYEMFTKLQDTLAHKEDRFQEEIAKERELREEIRRLLDEINNLTTELAVLKTERSMKLCEVRNCLQRKPQTGY